MNLVEAFKILSESKRDPDFKWQFWKPNTLPLADEVSEAYNLIASTLPEIAIPDLAAVISNADESSLDEFGGLFMELASRLPPSYWPVVDEKTRTQSYYHPDNSRLWDKRLFSRYPALLIIAFCHSSGRLRQRAVENCHLLSPQLAAPLLLVRVNDWVEQVRNAAAAKLTDSLQSLDQNEKMALVPVMLRLRECGRHHKAALLEEWLKVLVTPFYEPAWLAAWQAAKDRDKKSYLEILKISAYPPTVGIRRALLASNHRLALFWLIREVLPILPTDEREEGFSILRKSRVAAVKREWLTYCVDSRTPEDVEKLLKDALLDPSRSIRQLARFYLSQSSTMDFVSFYREALSHPKNEAIALEALTEASVDEAYREAIIRLNSETPAISKAALKALPEAALGNHLDFLLQAMGSELPGVPRIARKRLFQIRRLVGIELIAHPERWDSFPATTQIRLIQMAPEFQKWDSFEFLLSQLQQGLFRADLMAALQVCQLNIGRSFSKLQPARREKLLAYIASAGLTASESEKLRFLISRAE